MANITGTDNPETLDGTEDPDVIRALAGADTLNGRGGNDVLNGGAGADTMDGGIGDDTFYVDDFYDLVFEAPGEGSDTVIAYTSFVLGAGQEVELLRTPGSASTSTINLTGNEFAQMLLGSAGTNSLNGGAGADILRGYAGNDTYWVDDAGDQVIEASSGGNDTVIATASFVLGTGQEVETLRTLGSATTYAINFTGNAFAQGLYGNAGVNILDGKGGADTMRGYAGNDMYYVDNAGDSVIEAVGGGSDTVITSISYTLGASAEIETLRTYGSATTDAINLTGNGFANTLLGNAAANVLNGKGGADTLRGYAGDDVYYVDHVGDTVIEAASGGVDTVIAGGYDGITSYTLAAGQEIEILRTLGSASFYQIDLTGNEFANTIFGNSHDNVLDGAGGADTMRGYMGDDTYIVDNPGDVIVDDGINDDNIVIASVSYSIAGMNASINLLRTDDQTSTDPINLTGNGTAYGQTIEGNAGANILTGGTHTSNMWGFGGEDTFVAYSRLSYLRVEDFSLGDDLIGLRHQGFEDLSPGALDPNIFVIGTAALDADDRILYNSANGRLLWDPDGSGPVAPDSLGFATLVGAPAITASDFLVV